MAVESNYAIASLGDWLQNLAPVFQPIRSKFKPKLIAACTRDSSRAFSKLQVIARNSDWFTALFAPIVIGRTNYFGIGFLTVIWKL